MTEPHIILASTSPRRKDLLGRLGLSFESSAPTTDEIVDPGVTSVATSRLLSMIKATNVAVRFAESLVIGSDCVVSLYGHVLGKPIDAADAERTLRSLSGNVNEVISAVSVADTRSGILHTRHAITQITFRDLSDDEIRDYVLSGEPMDKAGSYAIQGGAGAFITSVEGCYNNVVGFPLCQLTHIFTELGITVSDAQACRMPNGDPCPLSN